MSAIVRQYLATASGGSLGRLPASRVTPASVPGSALGAVGCLVGGLSTTEAGTGDTSSHWSPSPLVGVAVGLRELIMTLSLSPACHSTGLFQMTVGYVWLRASMAQALARWQQVLRVCGTSPPSTPRS